MYGLDTLLVVCYSDSINSSALAALSVSQDMLVCCTVVSICISALAPLKCVAFMHVNNAE